MSEISLRAYVDYIQDRLDRDAYSEVVAQCRRVLESYPKYIEVYKLLARAVLAQENYQDATDLFQRVLSADPNDFVAHIGMSECYHEGGALDAAIWHLERAFEQAPSNLDLQEEIKRLYVEREGRAPREVQLTAGALARLYIKGKLYPQAILELRKALSQDPERPDLQVLLAEALWQNHQELEAGELAASVLRRLPNSISANRILAKLWLAANRPEEAAPFLERLEELNPYLAYAARRDGRAAPTDAFKLVLLEYTTEQHASEVGAAEWVSSIQSVEKSDIVTGSLQRSSPPATGAFNREEPAEAQAPGERAETLPDWLQGDYSSSLEAAGASPSGSDERPDDRQQPGWLTGILTSPSKSESSRSARSGGNGAPSWLDEVIGVGEPPPPRPPAPVRFTGDDDAPPTRRLHDVAPGWAENVYDEEGSQPDEVSERPEVGSPAGQQTPAWLSEVLDEPDEPPADVSPPPGPHEREAPDWLGEILSGHDEMTERDAQSAEAKSTAPPVVSTDWLDELISAGAGEEGEGRPVEGLFARDAGGPPPDWLRDLEAEVDSTGELLDFGELETWDGLPAVDEDEDEPREAGWRDSDIRGLDTQGRGELQSPPF